MANIREVIVNGISLVSNAFTPAVPHATTKHAIFKIRYIASEEQTGRLEKCIEQLEKCTKEKK